MMRWSLLDGHGARNPSRCGFPATEMFLVMWNSDRNREKLTNFLKTLEKKSETKFPLPHYGRLASRLVRICGRGDTHLLRLPGGALAADSHQQPVRASSVRKVGGSHGSSGAPRR